MKKVLVIYFVVLLFSFINLADANNTVKKIETWGQETKENEPVLLGNSDKISWREDFTDNKSWILTLIPCSNLAASKIINPPTAYNGILEYPFPLENEKKFLWIPFGNLQLNRVSKNIAVSNYNNILLQVDIWTLEPLVLKQKGVILKLKVNQNVKCIELGMWSGSDCLSYRVIDNIEKTDELYKYIFHKLTELKVKNAPAWHCFYIDFNSSRTGLLKFGYRSNSITNDKIVWSKIELPIAQKEDQIKIESISIGSLLFSNRGGTETGNNSFLVGDVEISSNLD